MDNRDRQIVTITGTRSKYTFEELRKKFWRIDKTFSTSEDYYSADGWIPAGSPGWTSSWEQTGGKDRQRFKNPQEGKETINFPVPNASALMLNGAKKAYEAARRLEQERFTAETDGLDELGVSDIIFDMLEEDMKSIIMAYTAIEAFANEVVHPEDEIYIKEGKGSTILTPLHYEEFRRMALEDKLLQVLPEKLKVSPIAKSDSTNTWQSYKELEKLRNEIIHMAGDDRQSNVTEKQSNRIWGRVYEAGMKWRTPAYMRAFCILRYFSRDASGGYPNWIVNFPHREEDKGLLKGS